MNLSVRLDEEAARALRLLQRSEGLDKSEAVRQALIRAARARFSPEAMRADAERLAADADNEAELRRIREEWDRGPEAW